MTGMSLGVNQLVTELKEGRDRVELLVSVGATRWEACGALNRAWMRRTVFVGS